MFLPRFVLSNYLRIFRLMSHKCGVGGVDHSSGSEMFIRKLLRILWCRDKTKIGNFPVYKRFRVNFIASPELPFKATFPCKGHPISMPLRVIIAYYHFRPGLQEERPASILVARPLDCTYSWRISTLNERQSDGFTDYWAGCNIMMIDRGAHSPPSHPQTQKVNCKLQSISK